MANLEKIKELEKIEKEIVEKQAMWDECMQNACCNMANDLADELKALIEKRKVLEKHIQAQCNHRAENGETDSIIYDSRTKECYCTRCKCRFHAIEPDCYDKIINKYSTFDILNSLKVLSFDNAAIFNTIAHRLEDDSYEVSKDLFDIACENVKINK